ncbi:MAG: single-stranded-DNA-specific exonuclease RecJ, partial [Planctomycetes bacterium]|nr:single-stranded-DNA-specific exonuclease RecJ [Planctomycetota bacterium]
MLYWPRKHKGTTVDTRWIFSPVDKELQAALADRLRVSPILAHILINRGLTDLDAARAFLRPELSGLHDPALLPGIEQAANRVVEAARNGQKIVVYGDYDVDGISGTALLLQCLRLLGIEADYYIPERLEEGYGLNVEAVGKLKAAGANLIVTTDCGISALDEAKAARNAGMDLIISDHHEPGPELPQAFAVINPKTAGNPYPFKDLSGVGVAFKLAWGIAQSFSGAKKVSPEFRDFLVNAV